MSSMPILVDRAAAAHILTVYDQVTSFEDFLAAARTDCARVPRPQEWLQLERHSDGARAQQLSLRHARVAQALGVPPTRLAVRIATSGDPHVGARPYPHCPLGAGIHKGR